MLPCSVAPAGRATRGTQVRLIAVLLFVALAVSPVSTHGQSRPFGLGVELDHIYLIVRPRAPEAAALRALGFRFADDTAHHQGNGTSSLAVMFDNAYLELLYPDSAVSSGALSAADRADRIRRLHWRENDVPPIGIGLRRIAAAPDALPFPTRVSTPPWLRPGTSLRLVTVASDSLAPSVFVVPRYMALTGWIHEALRDSLQATWFRHSIGARHITHVKVTIANPHGITATLRQLNDAGVVELAVGAHPLVELTLDGDSRNVTLDLRPALPLVIRY